MWNMGSATSCELSNIVIVVLLCGICGTAFSQNRQTGTDPESGKAVALAFVSLQVSDLQKSIDYYQSLGFAMIGNSNPPWIKDEALNRLYNTPGASLRTAVLKIPSTVSGKPFMLYLREFKDIERDTRADFPARDQSSTHLGLMVPEADALWEKLRATGKLRPLSWDGKLVRLPGQTSGGIAYVMDPDGLDVEIVGVRPQQGKTAGGQSVPSNNPTLHHLGLVVLDSEKSKDFYGTLLGAKFPDASAEWLSGDMYDAAVGGHGYVIRLINGSFPEAAAPDVSMNYELVEYQKPNLKEIPDYAFSDVAVSCVGFQANDLDAVYDRLKAADIKVWSKGGIVQHKDTTRSVVVRDPDVGAFVELFEKPVK